MPRVQPLPLARDRLFRRLPGNPSLRLGADMSTKETTAMENKYIVGAVDVRSPDFDNPSPVHDWRNHVGWRTVDRWHEFSDQQRLALALDAQDMADREEWE
jgi:hypothetical protein